MTESKYILYTLVKGQRAIKVKIGEVVCMGADCHLLTVSLCHQKVKMLSGVPFIKGLIPITRPTLMA